MDAAGDLRARQREEADAPGCAITVYPLQRRGSDSPIAPFSRAADRLRPGVAVLRVVRLAASLDVLPRTIRNVQVPNRYLLQAQRLVFFAGAFLAGAFFTGAFFTAFTSATAETFFAGVPTRTFFSTAISSFSVSPLPKIP